MVGKRVGVHLAEEQVTAQGRECVLGSQSPDLECTSHNKGIMGTSSVPSPQRQLDLTWPFTLTAGETAVELLREKVGRTQRQLDLTQPFTLATGETVELLRGRWGGTRRSRKRRNCKLENL